MSKETISINIEELKAKVEKLCDEAGCYEDPEWCCEHCQYNVEDYLDILINNNG